MSAPAVALDPERIRAARDEILAAREFDLDPTLTVRLFEWVRRMLEDLSLPALLGPLALAVLVVAIVALVIRLLPARAAGAVNAGGAAVSGGGRAYAEEREHARRALAEGRLADSVRATWLAAIALLGEAGLVRERRARADWEHVEAGRRARRELGPPLAAIAVAFQRSHFGAAALARTDAERCLAELTTLDRLVAEAAGGATRGT